MSLEYVVYIMWGPLTKRDHLFTIQTLKVNLGIGVELYSRHYAHESLFIH